MISPLSGKLGGSYELQGVADSSTNSNDACGTEKFDKPPKSAKIKETSSVRYIPLYSYCAC